MPVTTRTSLLSVCLLLLCGCAALPPGKRDPRDPWERMNRATYSFNDAIDRGFLKPVARGYRTVTPQFMRTGIGNFLDNLESPITMVNDLLQGQFAPFCSDTGRLLLNTTLGIGGLFDPASSLGLDKNDRDLGQTFGKWGASSGPYLVIPFLGPSDVRDAIGKVGDEYANPRHYIRNKTLDYSLAALRVVDTRARLLDAEKTLASAYDPYAFIRNAYLQHRDFKVHGGQSPSEEEQEKKLLEEAGEDQTAPHAPPAPATPPPPPDVPH